MTRTLREIRKAAAGERREIVIPASALKVELRADGEGGDAGVLKFSGHAAVFDTTYDVGGYFTETIKRGAFRKALAERQDTILNWDHDSRWPLARISAGNLALSEDTRGLLTEADIPLELSYAQDLKVLLDTRIIDGMSFVFTVLSDEWTESNIDGAYSVHRDVIEVDRLIDVCVTAIPCSTETDASSRTAGLALEIDRDAIARIAAIYLEGLTANEGTPPAPEGEGSEPRVAPADPPPADDASDTDDAMGEAERLAASRRRRIKLLEATAPTAHPAA